MTSGTSQRGSHEGDSELFSDTAASVLYAAVRDMVWLLSHGYARESSLKLVGDRHRLVGRQRVALSRMVCAEDDATARRARRRSLAGCADARLAIDGFNILVTIESALAGAVVLVCVDGAWRDLAGCAGTYRKVRTTEKAIGLLADALGSVALQGCTIFLDEPVSNSGRLRHMLSEACAHLPYETKVELCRDADRELLGFQGIVASSDSRILDGCSAWVNLAGEILRERRKDLWILDAGCSFVPTDPGAAEPSTKAAV